MVPIHAVFVRSSGIGPTCGVGGGEAETSRVREARGVAGSSQFDHRLSMVLVLVLVLVR